MVDFTMESCVRRSHVYGERWLPVVPTRGLRNREDPYAVAISKGTGVIVRHLPWEKLSIFQWKSGTISCANCTYILTSCNHWTSCSASTSQPCVHCKCLTFINVALCWLLAQMAPHTYPVFHSRSDLIAIWSLLTQNVKITHYTVPLLVKVHLMCIFQMRTCPHSEYAHQNIRRRLLVSAHL